MTKKEKTILKKIIGDVGYLHSEMMCLERLEEKHDDLIGSIASELNKLVYGDGPFPYVGKLQKGVLWCGKCTMFEATIKTKKGDFCYRCHERLAWIS